MAARTRSWIDPAAIQSQFVRGGDVYKTAVKVSDDVRKQARRRIHSRTRSLWFSVSASRHTLPLGVKFSVGAGNQAVNYARWVEEGTAGDGTGWIFPKVQVGKGGVGRKIGWLILYAGERAAPAQWMYTEGMAKRRVRGQRGRHYLRNGLIAGLKQNGLI